MSDSIKLSITLGVDPKILYDAWLNSKEHSEFTNSSARIEKKVGSTFTAIDGYIKGKNELLHMNKRIVQSWRTTDFSEDHADSTLEVIFANTEKGTKLGIVHSNLPENSGKKYRKFWRDQYFKVMKEYFEEK